MKGILPDICENYFGASGWMKLDPNGDKETADYDVWAVEEQDGTTDWRRVGRYIFTTDTVEWFK